MLVARYVSGMDEPWTGDACGLVEAFRSGERHPVEELEATLAAIERSDLNAFSFLAGAGGWQRWFFIVLALAISAWLLAMLRRHREERRLPPAPRP